jgi:hypothetical protein
VIIGSLHVSYFSKYLFNIKTNPKQLMILTYKRKHESQKLMEERI